MLRHFLFLCLSGFSSALPAQQQPLIEPSVATGNPELLDGSSEIRELRGKFLHISDLHPDPFYRYHSSTEREAACHRGEGPAGALGAETSDCDSPISLVNATFKWIDENLKDEIDFVIWTGDSARHDNDEEIPRSDEQIVQLNELVVDKFVEVFGKEDNINDTDPTNDLIIPIVPTWGNNDILPHNILDPGPNRWTKKYLSVWRKFIPEEQRHGFSRGGWFYVEVIPKQLAVFSLNTLYFFDSNTAVDGCAKSSEPGYEQMEWLRIQLQFLRERGMKAIMTGHVPPARTESKSSWDETCWQKYTLWMKQYRDVVVGGLYGHMNIDHFMLQDSKDISKKAMKGKMEASSRTSFDDELTTQSSADYLTELREEWAEIPKPPQAAKLTGIESIDKTIEKYRKKKSKKSRKHKKSKKEKFFDRIGGRWGERYSATLVSPSVVPNYFPTLRVFEYNVTGLDSITTTGTEGSKTFNTQNPDFLDLDTDCHGTVTKLMNSKSSSRKKRKKPKNSLPSPPSKSAPPGPAYSPQPLTLLSYTQYFANLTRINDDFVTESIRASTVMPDESGVDEERWHEGKHSGKTPKKGKEERKHTKFEFEVQYDTRTDKVYNLGDLTVRSYIDLASRIGRYTPRDDHLGDFSTDQREESSEDSDADKNLEASNKKGKKHRKHKKRKAANRVWFTFLRRAYVGSKNDEELRDEFA